MVTYRVEEISDGFYVLRVNDRYTRFFEALWEIPEGITYNAYLLKASEGDVLFDGWKKPFAGMLLDALEQVTSPDELKYIVVNHMEPDHSGSLEEVARWAPKAIVLGHPMAGKMLKAYPRAKERFKPVGDGEVLEIGGERIRFIHTPWLHWPETMMSWIEAKRILVTCDAFGGYGVFYGLYDDECNRWDDALRALQKYVVTVIGHYKQWIGKNIAKLEKLGVKPSLIAPAHGLIWRRNPEKVIEIYKELGEARAKKGKVLIVYASMYGTVETMIRRITCELSRKGYKPVVYGYTDSTRPYISEILTDAIDAEAIILAAPTYEADIFPLLRLVAEEICWKASDGKKALIVSSYGWGSVAAKHLRKIMEGCNYSVVETIEYNAIGPLAISSEEAQKIAEQVVKALEK
ncbi:MAG: FprA family A-type flavoprotein [Desulfurococcales archaeon]|nr:FprA family A-type flavoprotein [Desulfurococcales archaeon]